LGGLFAGLWGMPLLFVVSGLGAWYSLRSRNATGFVRERLARLLVPFVVGLLLVVPPQVYYQLRFEGQSPGSYWQFYRDFFQVHLGLKFPWFIRPDDPPDLFEPAHLWFLYFLLVYSLLLLPVLLYLRGNGRQLLERLASCARPWAILLLALPVAVIEAALGTEESGGWNRYAYIPFLLYGFWIITITGAAMSVVRRRARQPTPAAPRQPQPDDPAAGTRRLRDRAIRYANQAVLPVYVLHQTVIVMIGFLCGAVGGANAGQVPGDQLQRSGGHPGSV
jgi:Acyltransferase family